MTAQTDAVKVSRIVVGAEFLSDSCPAVTSRQAEPHPDSTMSYNPKEFPRMYPLELREDNVIWLWSDEGHIRWPIARFTRGPACWELQFINTRPFNKRVNWEHFKLVILQGYSRLSASANAAAVYERLGESVE